MLNRVIIVGHLGRDAELGETEKGTRYARLSIATSDQWRDKATGERRERTEWHRVVAWGDGLTAYLGRDAKKGVKVIVEGKLATREWTDKAGQKRSTTEIVVQGPDTRCLVIGQPSGGPPPPADPPESRHAGAPSGPSDDIPF